MRETLAVVRNRNMSLLLLGRTISTGGDFLYQVALMLAIYQYSHGKSYYIGLFWLVRLIPGLALGPFAGALADRMGYRPAMIVADLERLAFVTVLAFALHPGTWAVIYPIAFCVTAGSSLFNPANVGLIPALVPSTSERMAANAAVMQVTSLAGIVGCAAGGFGTGLGYQGLLLIDSATFAVSAITLFFIRTRTPKPSPSAADVGEETSAEGEAEGRFGGLLGGFRLVASRPVLVFAAAVMALPELASGASVIWVVPYAHDVLHLSASVAGYLYAALGVGALLGGFVAAAVGASVRLDYLLAGSIAAGGIVFALYGAIPILASALLFLLLVGLAETVEYAAFETLLQQAVPENMIGRAAGTLNSYLFNMMLIGNVLSGFLAAWIGVQISIGVLGALIVVVTGAGWWYLRSKTAGRPNALALARVPAFADVPLSVREWAVRRMSREDFEAGDLVIRQGDEGDLFYTIARGKVRAEVASDGATVRREMGPGDFFGEIALIQHVPRTASIWAETPLTVWVLGREDFEELQQRAGEFKESLLETAASRLTASPNMQMTIATRS